MSSTVHFVYKIPRHGTRLGKIVDYLSLHVMWFIPPWRFGKLIPWRTPIKAPHSITYHLYNHLKTHGSAKLYDLYEKRVCNLNAHDIFLATPMQAIDGRSWRDSQVYNITAKTCDRYNQSRNIFILMPYTSNERFNASVLGFIKEHGRNVILICGDYWTQPWHQAEFAPYVKKMLRVNMAIDAVDYPLVKTRFNNKGERGFLYVGHTEFYKNTAQLEAIATIMPGFRGGHVGRGQIRGWKKISDGADLTREFMMQVAKEYDIFLSTSTADAQATTILESMCFGFPVACTPESGYTYDSFVRLSTNDTEYNIEQLNRLQNADEKDLLTLAAKNREIAIQKHNWDTFCNEISNFIYENTQ